MGVNLDDLKAKGFFQNGDGSWSKPGATVPVDRLETVITKPTPAPALERCEPQSKQGMEGDRPRPFYRVKMVAFRVRLLNDDAKDQQFKAATDAIAAALGSDDEDKNIKWEWSQVETRGVEGVVVTIETVE